MATATLSLLPWIVLIGKQVVYEAFTKNEAKAFVKSYLESYGTASPVVRRNKQGAQND